jgi:hypothetical protein
MRAHEFITEVTIDNRSGWGAVPHNANVDYRGMAVKMKPSMFLALAAPLPNGETADEIAQHIAQGGAIGAPFLEIMIPDEWRADPPDFHKPARVYGHDGRHRMIAVQNTEGNAPVEVHLFLTGQRNEWRNRHMTPEVMQALNTQLIPQERGNLVKQGPFFTL